MSSTLHSVSARGQAVRERRGLNARSDLQALEEFAVEGRAGRRVLVIRLRQIETRREDALDGEREIHRAELRHALDHQAGGEQTLPS